MSTFEQAVDRHWNSPSPRHYAQGARCGHIEGTGRADQYRMGEEHDLSCEAAQNQGPGHFPNMIHRAEWERGYRDGYTLAAQGFALPVTIRDEELP